MPLFWMFSSMALLVIVFVGLLMYSMSYFYMKSLIKLNKQINFFLWW